MRLVRILTVQPDCLKGWVVCGIVYGDMHLKDLLGSFLRVGYRIPVPDFYLVLHGLRCRKSTIMDKSINQSSFRAINMELNFVVVVFFNFEDGTNRGD